MNERQLIVLLKDGRAVVLDADQFNFGYCGQELTHYECMKGNATIASFSSQEIIGIIHSKHLLSVEDARDVG